jgi:hypothetical protein
VKRRAEDVRFVDGCCPSRRIELASDPHVGALRKGVLVRIASLVACAAIALVARTARAGCPNTCAITVEPSSVAPPLDCLEIEVTPEACDRGVFVKMTNGCAAAIQTEGWTFASCGQPGESAGSLTPNCSALAPTAVGSSPLRTSGTGSKEWPLQVTTQGTSYVVTVAANVTSFSQGGGCAMSPGLAKNALFGAALALVGAFVWSKRRRARGVARACNSSAPSRIGAKQGKASHGR